MENTKKKKKLAKKINIDKLKDAEIRRKYQDHIKKSMSGKTYKNEQDQWDKMTKACLEASAEILGYEEKKRKTKTTTDPEVKTLSDKQKNLRIKINTAKTSSQKEYLKKNPKK